MYGSTAVGFMSNMCAISRCEGKWQVHNLTCGKVCVQKLNALFYSYSCMSLIKVMWNTGYEAVTAKSYHLTNVSEGIWEQHAEEGEDVTKEWRASQFQNLLNVAWVFKFGRMKGTGHV
jgi:hypothetical protein